MAISVQNYIKMVNYYNQTMTVMAAICVQKGGIAIENYVGRFYAADILEYLAEYGRRLRESGVAIDASTASIMKRIDAGFDAVRDLATPTQKPIYEMTLAEFEKVMNI